MGRLKAMPSDIGLVTGASAKSISAAANFLRAGKLVAFPTETVYGLGGDATNSEAVAHIFEAKGRPAFNPLICHVSDIEAAREIAAFSLLAEKLAAAFWPGPLTLVLPRAAPSPVSQLVSAGMDTIAVRVPANETAQALLRAVGRPVAAPSANASGSISPTRAAHVVASLGDKIDVVLDGGTCDIGLESTILLCVGDKVSLLRSGGLETGKIEKILGSKILSASPDDAENKPLAPGRLKSHYAPRTKVRTDISRVEQGESLLAFGSDLPEGSENARAMLNLSDTGNLVEAAANLFDFLHQLDETGASTIACAKVPETGLGVSINDRLRRAAAPRDND